MTLIRNETFFKQRPSYHNMEEDDIYPTDIDGLIDWKDKVWIIVEFKHKGYSKYNLGQEVALKRLADDLSKTKLTYLIFAEHESDDEIFDASLAKVVRLRVGYKWIDIPNEITIKKLIQSIKNYWK